MRELDSRSIGVMQKILGAETISAHCINTTTHDRHELATPKEKWSDQRPVLTLRTHTT